MDIGIRNRTEVLATSLWIENLTSAFLCGLLRIKDIENSRIFGNKSSSISFNQKIDLLIEIGALSKDEKKKFQTFMEIRNQFIHNLGATTYIECLSFTDKKENYLLRTYPQGVELSKEQQLRNAVKQLGGELLNIISTLIEKVKERIKLDVEGPLYKLSFTALEQSIRILRTELDNYFDKIIKKQEKINSKELKGFGTEIHKMISAIWKKKYKELQKK